MSVCLGVCVLGCVCECVSAGVRAFVCVHSLRGFMECRCSRVRVLVFVCVDGRPYVRPRAKGNER